MGQAPKRPRGRPPQGEAPLTTAEHSRRYRERGARCVTLRADVLAEVDALAQRHGDASRAACVTRLVHAAASQTDQ